MNGFQGFIIGMMSASWEDRKAMRYHKDFRLLGREKRNRGVLFLENETEDCETITCFTGMLYICALFVKSSLYLRILKTYKEMKRTVSLLICLPLFLLCLCPPAMAQTDELDDLMSQAKKAVKRNQLSQADSLYNAYVALYNEQGIDKGYKYCEVLIWLAQYASKHSQIDKAIGVQKEVVEVCNVAKDCNPAQRATAISELSTFYVSKGNYSNAIEAGTQAVEAMARVYGEKNHYYSITLLNLAVSYSARGKDGDAEKAVELGERAIKHMKKTTAEYTRALNSMVIFYTQKGDLVAAARYSAKARRQASNYIDISKDGVNYATQLNNTAIRLAKLGSYDEAIENEKMACEYIAQSGGVNTLLYGKLLMNLGIFYAHQQRFQESIAVLQQALPILENTVTKHHQDYVRCVSELSSVYRNSGNLDKAKELAEVSEEVSSELGEVDNIRYAKSLSKQAAIFASNGNFSRAIECEQEALHIFATRRDTMDMAFSMAA